MSKYRIVVKQAWIRRYTPLLPVFCAWLALLCLPDPVWTWLATYTLVLPLTLATFAIGARCHCKHNPTPHILTLYENGKVVQQGKTRHATETEVTHHGLMSGRSRLTFWGIWLCVTSMDSTIPTLQRCWILKNECNEADYRRLCRQVLLAQRL